MDDHKQCSRNRLIYGVLFLFVVVVIVPFLPLLAAFAEHVFFGTHEVDEFFYGLGIHDELGLLYRAVGIGPG
jgi:hypothetical protein